MGDLALAIDIGGTKMEAGLVDSRGVIVDRKRRPTLQLHGGSSGPDPETLFTSLVELIVSLDVGADAGDDDSGRIVVCGVGCGGPMEKGGETVSPLNIRAWRRFPLRARLAEITGVPVVIDNDAKALALGERWLGAGVEVDNYIAMVVSTGVGGGIVIDGQLVDGRFGNAGHVGHLVVVPGGRRCGCGGKGCLEAEASGTAIAAITGRPASEASPEVINRTGTLVGRAVACVTTLLDIECAIVAGSVALGFGEPFFAAAQAEISRCTHLDFARNVTIYPALLGADGPLIGAAAVGWRSIGLNLRPS